MKRQPQSPRGEVEAGAGALAVAHLLFRERAVRLLSDGIDVETEEQIAHRGVSGHHDLDDAAGIVRQVLQRPGEIAQKGALQQPPAMLGVVLDACHDVGAAEPLRVLEGVRCADFTCLQIEEAHHDGCGSKVDGKAVKTEGNGNAPDDIEDRLILPMVNEAVACLAEGVIGDADLLDAGVIFGTGFAPFRGGPIQYARSRGIGAVVTRLKALEAEHGPRFAPHEGWSEIE